MYAIQSFLLGIFFPHSRTTAVPNATEVTLTDPHTALSSLSEYPLSIDHRRFSPQRVPAPLKRNPLTRNASITQVSSFLSRFFKHSELFSHVEYLMGCSSYHNRYHRFWIMTGSLRLLILLVLLAAGLAFNPESAYAYGGPGSVISGIGTLLALIAALLASVFGFLWFPLKRLYKKLTDEDEQEATPAS